MKSSLFKLLYGLYKVGTPTMIWGDPGEGKTSTIVALGKFLEKPCLLKSANKSDPSDFEGLPITKDDGNGNKIVEYVPPEYVRTCNTVQGSILFFDEITTCPRVIQNALLSIIQDCQFGEFTIPQSTFRCAAGNYDSVAGCHGMGSACMNRFCHLHFDLDLETFVDGLKTEWKNVTYDLPEINSPEEQMKEEINLRIMIGEFLKQNPNYFKKVPTEFVEKEDVAFPTPRSWESVMRILSVLSKNDVDYLEVLVQGTIGKVAGTMFLNYFRSNHDRGVDLTKYVGREDSFVLPHPDRHDEVDNIISSIVYYLKRDPKKFLDLWIRISNLAHNENHEYGKYIGYDGQLMKHMKDCVKILLDSKVVKPQELKNLKDKVKAYSLMSVF